MVKMLRSLAWHINLGDVPGGISLFHLSIWNPKAADDGRMLYCIDLKREFKQQLTEAEFKELSSQTVYVPQSFRELVQTMKFQLNLFGIFLGKDAKLCREYGGFIRGVEAVDREIDSYIYANEEFPAKLFLRVDSILGRFINSVFAAAEVKDAKWRALHEFDLLLDEIEQRRFIGADLPTWISKIENPNSNSGEGKPTDKIPKEKEGGKKMRDTNEKVVAKLKISDEDYKKKVVPIHGDDRPKLCLRYHTRGWCFKSPKMCKHHSSHKPLTKRQEDEIFALLVKNGLKKEE